MKTLLIGLLLFVIAIQCKPKSSSDAHKSVVIEKDFNQSPITKFDSVVDQLKPKKVLLTSDLVALKMIDTSLKYSLGENSYCDTTVQLNDSIYFSIISIGDSAGLCSYLIATSWNEKNKQVITSKYLYPDCDIDYSWDFYETYEHSIISNNQIQITKTIVYQKKDRKSEGDDEDVDHKTIEKTSFVFLPTGEIKSRIKL